MTVLFRCVYVEEKDGSTVHDADGAAPLGKLLALRYEDCGFKPRVSPRRQIFVHL